MNVRELKERLAEMPDWLEVFMSDGDGRAAKADQVRVIGGDLHICTMYEFLCDCCFDE